MIVSEFRTPRPADHRRARQCCSTPSGLVALAPAAPRRRRGSPAPRRPRPACAALGRPAAAACSRRRRQLRKGRERAGEVAALEVARRPARRAPADRRRAVSPSGRIWTSPRIWARIRRTTPAGPSAGDGREEFGLGGLEEAISARVGRRAVDQRLQRRELRRIDAERSAPRPRTGRARPSASLSRSASATIATAAGFSLRRLLARPRISAFGRRAPLSSLSIADRDRGEIGRRAPLESRHVSPSSSPRRLASACSSLRAGPERRRSPGPLRFSPRRPRLGFGRAPRRRPGWALGRACSAATRCR